MTRLIHVICLLVLVLAIGAVQIAQALPNTAPIPGRILVRYPDGLVVRHPETVQVEARVLDWEVLRVPEGEEERYVEAYRKLGVEAERDYEVHALGDPMVPQQWALRAINAQSAWAITKGAGVTVAVVDTGVDCNHQDLTGACVGGWDFVNNDGDPRDDHGHGTHVAGIIGARENGIGIVGVAPESRIMPVKVLSAGGSGSYSGVSQGIVWAVDHGARVINLSLGGYMDAGVMRDAVEYAASRGVVVVAAAGNDGANYPLYPAAYDTVIAVAATDWSNQRAGFSNWGSWVELAAPGVQVLSSTRGGYQSWSGTSMATPHVAAVAALLCSVGVCGRSAREKMDATATDLGEPGRDLYYGYGLVDAARAVGGQPPPPTSTPVPTNMPSPTPYPTWTPKPTETPLATLTPYPTATPRPTSTPWPTRTPRPTWTPRPTVTPTTPVDGCVVTITGLNASQQRWFELAAKKADMPYRLLSWKGIELGPDPRVGCR